MHIQKTKNTKYGNRRYRATLDDFIDKKDEVKFIPRSRTFGADARRLKSYQHS